MPDKTNDLAALVGTTVIRAEHTYGDSDADEKVLLEFSDGSMLTIGTSEWLDVTVVEQGATYVR